MFTSSAPLYNLQASIKQISISSSHSSLKSQVNSARFKVPVAEMKKLVLKLDLHSEKDKKKVMKAVSDIHGIDSISIDMNDKKLTIMGAVDPVTVVAKLRKSWHTELLSVGPAKEEKKEEAKNKEGDKDKEKGKEKEKEKSKDDQIAEVVKAYQTYNAYYYVQSVEENPNACEIM